MAQALTTVADGDGPVPRKDERVRERGCRPSELIVHYYLDDLSPAEHKDLTDHLSGCDLCSARLLALEISAELSIVGVPADSGLTFADPERYAGTHRRARKLTPSRRDRYRARRAAIPTVVSLGDRNLTTTVGLALDFGDLAGVPEVRILETSVARLPLEPREHNLRVGSGVSLSVSHHWDLAIDELYGSGLSSHLRVTGEGPHAAA
jgi:hypothetical protein